MSGKAPGGSSRSGKLPQLHGEQAGAGEKQKAGKEVGCHPGSGECVARGGVRLGCQGPGGTESREEQVDWKAGGTDLSFHTDSNP